MTAESYAFVNGPVMVAEFTGVQIATDELGGAAHLDRHSRRAQPRRRRPAERPRPSVIDLLGYLPSSADEEPGRWP